MMLDYISQQISNMLKMNVKLVMVSVITEAWQNGDMLQKTLTTAFSWIHTIGILNESFLKLYRTFHVTTS